VEFYVNIASPYIFEEDTLKYIDFDLDFKIIGHELNFIKKLDEHEFDENKKKYNYPDSLINKINEAQQEIETMYKNKTLKNLIIQKLLFK
jgi:protein associated with RNAse G/E